MVTHRPGKKALDKMAQVIINANISRLYAFHAVSLEWMGSVDWFVIFVVACGNRRVANIFVAGPNLIMVIGNLSVLISTCRKKSTQASGSGSACVRPTACSKPSWSLCFL